MKYTAEQYAAALHQAIGESRAEDQEKVLNNFVQILRERQDLPLVDEIEKVYLLLDKKAQGVANGEIFTAKPLSEPAQAELVKKLNRYIAGKAELKAKVDEGLIGGFVVRVGDTLIDGSVKKGLSELKKEMAE